MIGIKVKHKFNGEGEIVDIKNNVVFVEYPTKTAKIPLAGGYAEAHLRAADPADQQEIDDYIKKFKEAEAAKAKAADEARLAEEKARVARESVSHEVAKLGEEYHAEHLSYDEVYTYEEVQDKFGIQIQGFGRGINEKGDVIVLISSLDDRGENFVYHDKWESEDVYIYSGEGSKGDQTMTGRNAAVLNAAADGKTIYLIVKFDSKKYCLQGVFELVDHIFEPAPDKDGNIRQEIKFKLKKV